MRPPRALFCEFPLGRPLGKPDDPTFQRRVIEAALALLRRPNGPVLEDFPEVVTEGSATPLTCVIPPRDDSSDPAAVGEARGLRDAYDRQLRLSGRTGVGHAVKADQIPEAVAGMLRIASGVPLAESALPGQPSEVARDICAFFEEAAIAIAGHVPAARQAESWLFRNTSTGLVLKRAQLALRDAGHAESVWFSIVPYTQQDG